MTEKGNEGDNLVVGLLVAGHVGLGAADPVVGQLGGADQRQRRHHEEHAHHQLHQQPFLRHHVGG